MADFSRPVAVLFHRLGAGCIARRATVHAMRTPRGDRAVAGRKSFFVLIAALVCQGFAFPAQAAMRVASGFYLGLGIVNQPVLTVGFQPEVVIVKAITAQVAVCRTTSMSGSKELGASTALQGNRIISFDPLGFTVGTHASVNALATIYHWVAFQSAPGEMEIGSYTGNGADDRALTGFGLEPEYAIVIPSAAQHAVQRFAGQPDDASFRFDASAAAANGIQSFLSDGLELGSSAEVNASGQTYHYLAWRGAASAVDVGSYVGNVTDDRSITAPGFLPGWVLVRGSGTNPVHRPASLLLDTTLPIPAAAQFANGIQALNATGFQVGTHASVNSAGSTYYFAAFADNPNGHADLSLELDVDAIDPLEGQTVELTLRIENAGPATATTLVIDLPLPDGLTYLQSSGAGTYTPATGAWEVASLASGAAAALSVQAAVDLGTMGEQLEVEARLDHSDQGDPTSQDHLDQVTLTIGGIDLAVEVSESAETATPGEEVSFTITLANLSAGDATGIVLQNQLHAGITYLSHQASAGSFQAGAGQWSLDLGPLDEETLVVHGSIGDDVYGQLLTDVASIAALDQTDPVAANDEASASIYATAADVGVELIVDLETPIPGAPVIFTITATNHGPDPATQIQIRDILPEELTLVLAVPSTGTYSAATGLWQFGQLAVDQSAQLLITALVALVPDEGVIANTAELIVSLPFDQDPDNDSDTVILSPEGSDLELDVSADDLSPEEGDTVEIEFEVTNHGPAPTLAATVTIDLDPGLTVISSEASAGLYLLGAWVIPALAADGTETLTFQCRLAPGTGGTQQTASGVVVLDPPFVDPISDNDDDSVTLTVSEPASADLSVEIEADEASPRSGELVEIIIRARNDGPDAASGVEVSVDIDDDLSPVGQSSNQGSYTESSGSWTVGSLAAGAQKQLVLTRRVEVEAIGRDLAGSANISADDPPDPDGGDDQASTEMHVASADLSLDLSADNADPSRGDIVHLYVDVENSGPDDALDADVSISLPSGVTFLSALPSKGTYDSASRVWSIGAIGDSQDERLDLAVEIGPGSTTRTVSASITETNPDDPSENDWSDTQALRVHGVDLAIHVDADADTPDPGATVEFLVTLSNEGDGDASGIAVDLELSSELSVELVVPHAGSYSAVNRRWTLSAIDAQDVATLAVKARVADTAGGLTLSGRAFLADLDQLDGDPANNDHAHELTIPLVLDVRALDLGNEPLTPGGSAAALLSFEIENPSLQPALLRSIEVSDDSEGPGSQTQRDANLTGLSLLKHDGADWTVLRSGTLSQGRSAFGNLNLILDAQSVIELRVDGAASLTARDGDIAGLIVAIDADLVADSPARIDGSFPIDSGSRRPIDGMVAAQVELRSVGSSLASPGAQRVPLFGAILPANGYESDALERLVIAANESGAGETDPNESDVSALELWIDDGDALFEPNADAQVGAFSPNADAQVGAFSPNADAQAGTSARRAPNWIWEGDPIPVPTTGLPIFITANLSGEAPSGLSLRLEIPLGDDPSIEMASGNDGPLDAALNSPDTVTIEEEPDTPPVTWSALPLLTTSVHPGAHDVVLLRLRAQGAATLTRLAAHLAIVGSGSEEDALDSVRLTWDVDGNGLSSETDQPIAEGNGPEIVFEALQWPLSADQQIDFLVSGDVPLHALADGDQIVASISGPNAISMDGAAVAGNWPLQSGSCGIDGMVAAQIHAPHHGLVTIGPGAGPARLFEVVVPSDGPLDDTLEQLRFVSRGNATTNDFAELRLYRDGGDGAFPSNDDLDLGPLVPLQGGWSSDVLQESIASGGARFFVGLTASETPSDSSVIQLEIPINGIDLHSDNDGPLDQAVAGAEGVRIVARGLIAQASASRERLLVGSELDASLVLENPSLESISLTELEIAVTGEGSFTLLDAPHPEGLILGAMEARELSFRFLGTGAGTVSLTGSARGVGVPSGSEYRSFESSPVPVSIVEPADRLLVSSSPPQSVRKQRGDQNVVLWTMSLTHPGVETSSILLSGLRLRLEDEEGASIAAPAELVERIRLTSSQGVHATTFPQDSELMVELTPPIELEPGQSMDLRIAVDIAADAPLGTLRMVAEDAGSLTAQEDVEARPVSADAGINGFPMRSDLLVMFEAATELVVKGASPTTVRALQGSEQVPLAQLELVNPGKGVSSSSIDLERVALTLSQDGGLFFERLQLLHAGSVVAQHVPIERTSETIVLRLDTPITVPANSVAPLRLQADLRDDAPFASVRARFTNAELFLARDRQTRERVPVVLDQDGFSGNLVRVERPAEGLTLESAALLPTTVLIGARDVDALRAVFHHPGDSLTSRAQLLSIELECRDAQFAPLVPSIYLDAVRAFVGEELIGEVRELPEETGPIHMDLEDFLLEPGSSTDVIVRLDFAPGTPLGQFQVVGESAKLAARDANHLRNIPVEPLVPGEPALFSGLTRLQEPPRRLLVGLQSALPRNIAAGDDAVLAGTLRLTNPAEASAGPIVLASVELQVADRAFAPVAVSRVEKIYLEHDGEVIESVFSSQESPEAILNLAEPREIAAGETIELPFSIVPGALTGVSSLRLGVSEADIGVVQPRGALFQVAVEAEEGEFPLWTSAAQLGPEDLRESFSNFPNPFSGGQEQTTFVWYQATRGQVTLRLWTLLGDRVTTVFEGELPGGLHQEIRWDGRNGRGDVVANGSYLAELIVGFEDGTEQRIRRKVAVAR